MAVGRRVLLVGKLLVVEVVQQADQAPGLGILAVPDGIRAHGRLDREHVLAQRRGPGVLLHERQRFVTIHEI